MNNIVDKVNTEVSETEERCKKYTDERLEVFATRIVEREHKYLDIIDGIGDNVLKLTRAVGCMNNKYNFRISLLSVVTAVTIAALGTAVCLSGSRISSLENDAKKYEVQINNLADEMETIRDDQSVTESNAYRDNDGITSFNTRAGIIKVISDNLRGDVKMEDE